MSSRSDSGFERSRLDQQLGSLLDSWVHRDLPADRCRFCTEEIGDEQPPQDRFCDDDCEDAFDLVLEARLEIGQRDLEQRGYD